MLAVILVIHSLIEGAALGVNATFSTASVIFVAIIAHKGSESFALAVILNRSQLSLKAVMITILIFALMACVTAHGIEKLRVAAFNGLAPNSGAPMLAMPLDSYGIETRNYWPDEKWAENFLCALKKQKKIEMSFPEWKEKYGDIYKPINDDFAAELGHALHNQQMAVMKRLKTTDKEGGGICVHTQKV